MNELNKDIIKTITKDVADGIGVDFAALPIDEETTIDFIINNVMSEVSSLSDDPMIRDHQLVSTICALSLLIFLQELKYQELQKNAS